MKTLHGKKIKSRSTNPDRIKKDVTNLIANRKVLMGLVGKFVSYTSTVVLIVSDRNDQRNYILDRVDGGYILTEIKIKQLK
jgi:hypothetical protein